MTYERIDQEVIDDDLHITIFRTTVSPNWYVQLNLPGAGQRKQSLKTNSKKEARSRARRIARDLEAGSLLPKSNRAATIEEAAGRHIEYLADRNRNPKTLEIYRQAYDQLVHWGRSRGITSLRQLTVANLERFEGTLRDEGIALPQEKGKDDRRRRATPLKPKTLRERMKNIRALIKWAATRDMVAADPARGYRLPPCSEDDRQIWTPEELALIENDPDPCFQDVWRFLRMTGLRISEFCWLLKDDIQDGQILIRRKTCPQTGKVWRPKHGLERVVPMVDASLVAIVQRALATSPSPWLFHAPGVQTAQVGHWRENRLRQILHDRLELLEIGYGSPHTFRHVFCTFLANHPAMPITHVQKIMGHQDIKTTMAYVHTTPADIAESMSRVRLDEMLNGSRTAGAADSQKSAKTSEERPVGAA